MPALQKIAFVVHQSKPGALALAQRLTALAKTHGVITQLTTDYPLPQDFLAGQEACAVIGGDGTILSTVAEAVRHQVPTFGINQGHLGFLASLAANDAADHFADLLKGQFTITHRPIIQAEFANRQKVLALNDVVIKHSHLTRMLTLRVRSNNEWVTDYTSDGLIFSTPTGSTAYNLSAGGPIIHPEIRVIAMTPICPHTLSNRSVIFPSHAVLEIQCEETHHQPNISLDGQIYTGPEKRFPIRMTLSETSFPLLQPSNTSYFKTLRSKLKWGNSATSE